MCSCEFESYRTLKAGSSTLRAPTFYVGIMEEPRSWWRPRVRNGRKDGPLLKVEPGGKTMKQCPALEKIFKQVAGSRLHCEL